MIGRPYQFSFDRPSPAPDWIIHGITERGCVTMLSADAGAGKSLITDSMAIAVLHGDKWCGRKTTGTKCLFVDEENAPTVFDPRLKALGLRPADLPNLRYYSRMGVQLGTGGWFDEIADEIADFKPDLTVIDTVAAATAVTTNDNDSIARFFAQVLRPLSETTGLVILHHERKPTAGQPRNAAHAMMGGRQWAGQADSHVALRGLGKPEIVKESSTRMERRYYVELETGKDRGGFASTERLAVRSEHELGEDGLWNRQAKWLRVEKARRDS